MNENAKTVAFVAVGIAAIAVGVFVSRPSTTEYGAEHEIGKEMFPEFTDPRVVAAAEVVAFDSSSDTKRDLKAARVDGVWVLNPKRQDYPEVNLEQLADVVTAVRDLKKLSVVTDDRSQHREFGVVDPGNEAELKEGTEGVGKRVDLLDENGRSLVRLIVGKADKDNTKLHFVREPSRDRVYRTEIDANKLTSRFEDWVPGDLLGASGGDLRFVAVNDYGIDLSQEARAPIIQGGAVFMPPQTLAPIYRAKAVLRKEPSKKTDAPSDAWQFQDFQSYDPAKKAFVERKVATDEEVEAFKLNELARTLGNIKIVDVVKKPASLAADLEGDESFLTNAASPVREDREALMELIRYGFRLQRSPNGQDIEMVCFEGELTVGFANGVEYVLRMGDITGKGSQSAADGKAEDKKGEDEAADAADDGAAKGSSTAPNRYLMVSARFNETLIPKPQLTELPAADAKPADDKPADDKKTADEAKPAEAAKEPATKVGNDAAKEDADEAEADDAALADDAKADDEPTKSDAKPADDTKPADNAKPAESAKPAGDTKPAEAAPAMTPEERKQIESENQTKQENYDAAVKAGREKADELNAKFAEWYYVISDSTYRSLDVDPTGLLRKAEPAAKEPAAASPDLPLQQLLPNNPAGGPSK